MSTGNLSESMDLKSLVSDPSKLPSASSHMSAEEAFYRLKNGDTDPILLKVLLTDKYWTFQYVRQVKKEPFPQAEPLIAQSPILSYYYALWIVRDPFPLGEPTIYKSRYKDAYEQGVLKGRPWTGLDQKVDEAIDLKKLVTNPKKLKTHDTHISPVEAYRRLLNGETDEYLVLAVAKDAPYSYRYSVHVLKKPFPLGEPEMAKYAYWSCAYALQVLKGPFPLGEPAIYKDEFWRDAYERRVLKGRPWTGLDQKVDEAIDLKKLVSDPAKLKNLEKYISPEVTVKQIQSYAKKNNGIVTPKMLEILVRNSFAPSFINKPIKSMLEKYKTQGIEGIAKNLNYAALYVELTHSPCTILEPILSTTALSASNYAYVTKKPFPLGEPAIARSGTESLSYARHVLKNKPFPLGEPAIAKSAELSAAYAVMVLGKPFPLGEPAIYNNATNRRIYKEKVLKGRRWTGLKKKKKVKEELDLKKLVSDPKKLQTHDTHFTPTEALDKLKSKKFRKSLDKDAIHALESIIAKDARTSFKYAIDVLKGPFPLGEPIIAKNDIYSYLYAMGVLKGPFKLGEPIIAKHSIHSVEYARDVLKGRFKKGERKIAKDAFPSYLYAKHVLKGPFPLGEPAIYNDNYWRHIYQQFILKGKPWTGLKQKIDESIELKNLVSDPEKLKTYKTHINPEEAFKRLLNGETDEYLIRAVAKSPSYSYQYATMVLGKPFPLGEPTIATSGYFSFHYARDVLEGPFPLGEPAIAEDPKYSYLYALFALNRKPFPLGEPAIAKRAFYSLYYANDVLKGPFPLGEPAIYRINHHRNEYEEFVLKGRPWTNIDQKVDEAMNLKNLVSDPKKLKTHDTHLNAVETVKYKIENGVAPTQEDLTKVYNETNKQWGPNIWLSQQDKILNFNDILKSGKFSYLFAKNILNKPFPLGEKAIATSPSAAASYAAKVLQDRFPLGEPKILTSPYWSYFYAEEVIKGPWPIAEPIIAEDSYYAFEYSKYVLKAPFPMAEEVIYDNKYTRMEYELLWGSEWKGIEGDLPDDDDGDDEDLFNMAEAIDLKKLVSDPTKLKTYDTHVSPEEALERLKKGDTDEYLVKVITKYPKSALIYAQHVLKGPFPLGEPAIAKDAGYSYIYARAVLDGPFPLGEPAIAKDGHYSYLYAKYVLNGPFSLGEPEIYKDPDWKRRYVYYVLQRTPWPSSDQPITEAIDLKKLVSDPTKLQTYDTHLSPKEALDRLLKGQKEPYLEAIVAKDTLTAYNYALAIQKPFPLGEETILKDPVYAAVYARNVLKEPWPLAEPIIATSASASWDYANKFGPFPLGEPVIAKWAEFSYEYSKYVLKAPFLLGEPVIYADPFYRTAYENLWGSEWKGIKGDLPVDDDDPDLFTEAIDLEKLVSDPKKLKTLKTHVRPTFQFIRQQILERGYPTDKELEHLQKMGGNFAWLNSYNNKTVTYDDIKNHPGLAYYYARDILRGPFPEGEAAIATSAIYSYWYAKDILKGPFPLGEPAIAKDKEYSYRYAKDVLNGPFPLGEPAIAKVTVYSFDYAYNITKKPFPLGEPAIAKNLRDSILYARDILKGRFILAEPSIYQNDDLKDWYEKDVLGGKPLEPSNITEAIDLTKLVTEPKKLKKLKTHIKPTVKFIRQQILKRGYPTDKELKHLYTLSGEFYWLGIGDGRIATYKNIKDNSGLALDYATTVLKGPFPEGEPAIAMSSYNSYLYAKSALKGPFPLGEPMIADDVVNSFRYAQDVLKGPFPLGEKKIATNSILSFEYAAHITKKPFPLGEPAISRNPYYSLLYAIDVLKGRFLLAEPTINATHYKESYEEYVLSDKKLKSTDVTENMDLKNLVDNPKKLKTYKTHLSPREAYDRLKMGQKNNMLIQILLKDINYAFLYVTNVLKGRFPEAEPLFAKSGWYSVAYAMAINDRFELGEPVIAQTISASFDYAIEVLKGRFLLGEPVIAESPSSSLEYASHIVKGPFPLGEPAIATYPQYAYEYAVDVLHDRFSLGEETIMQNPKYAYLYAKNVIKGPWKQAEPVIKNSIYYQGYLNLNKSIEPSDVSKDK